MFTISHDSFDVPLELDDSTGIERTLGTFRIDRDIKSYICSTSNDKDKHTARLKLHGTNMFRRCLSLVALAVVGLSSLVGQAEGVKFEMTARAYPETSELRSGSMMGLCDGYLIR